MLNPSFTRGEFWLLNNVVEKSEGISGSLECRNYQNGTLKIEKHEYTIKCHFMDDDLLFKSLYRLLKDEFIQLYKIDKSSKPKSGGYGQIIINLSEIPTLESFKLMIEDKTNSYGYELTALGGEAWEEFAEVDWNKFVKNPLSLRKIPENDVWSAGLMGQDKDFLQEYLNSLAFHKYAVIESTIKWDTVEPWQATYWKQLPLGHRVQFDFIDRDLSQKLIFSKDEIHFKNSKPIKDPEWYRNPFLIRTEFMGM